MTRVEGMARAEDMARRVRSGPSLIRDTQTLVDILAHMKPAGITDRRLTSLIEHDEEILAHRFSWMPDPAGGEYQYHSLLRHGPRGYGAIAAWSESRDRVLSGRFLSGYGSARAAALALNAHYADTDPQRQARMRVSLTLGATPARLFVADSHTDLILEPCVWPDSMKIDSQQIIWERSPRHDGIFEAFRTDTFLTTTPLLVCRDVPPGGWWRARIRPLQGGVHVAAHPVVTAPATHWDNPVLETLYSRSRNGSPRRPGVNMRTALFGAPRT